MLNGTATTAVLQKFKHTLSYDPAIWLLEIYPKEFKVRELKQCSVGNPVVHQWVNKQNVLCTYSGILFNLKEGSFDTSCNIDEPKGHYAKWISQ